MHRDYKLAKRILQGERAAFAELVDRYGAPIRRLVGRYIENPADADDVTQAVFCDLYRCIGQYRGEAALTTWAYRIAVNRALRHCKRRPPDCATYDEQEIEDVRPGTDPANEALKGELSQQVHSAIHALSPPHADVVILCELEGLTYAECATVLEIPVGTVKSRLNTASRRLRDRLAEYVLGEPSSAATRSFTEVLP